MKNLKGGNSSLYYSYKNALYSRIAQANKIDNLPGSDYSRLKKTIDNPIELLSTNIKINLHKLFKYCINPLTKKFGRDNVALTSVYRNKEVNKLLGGVENSQHIFGYAADIIFTNGDPTSKLFNWCRFNLPEYHQLIWEYPERGTYLSVDSLNTPFSWVHISYIEGDNYKTNSVSSENPKIHEAYQDENTFYIDNFTHKIDSANQQLLEE
tara:strand:- start:1397 stop:2026 length:630 start_codon:yes stop_codon:yes gene_type:complete